MAGGVEMAVPWAPKMLIKISSSLTRQTEKIGPCDQSVAGVGVGVSITCSLFLHHFSSKQTEL